MNRYRYLIFGILALSVLLNNSFSYGQISNLIMPVTYFVGGEEQFSLLAGNLNKYRKASVVGTSGIGKTQLVRMYALQNRDNYDLIWFFDCNVDINTEFVRLAKQLNQNTNANLSEDSRSARSEVMSYLAHQHRWLLVFDNLKVNTNSRVQDFVEWENNGNIIFSSQDSKQLVNTIEMTSLNKQDSIKLANNLLENKNKDDISFLIEISNGYPILIVQGAQVINKVSGLDKGKYKNKIYKSVEKIRMNIELVITELSPSASLLLGKIALINNQSFSRNILKVITDYPEQIDDDIIQLLEFVLIAKVNSDPVDPVFEMHDIIALKVMEINDYNKNKRIIESIVDKVAKAIPNNGRQPPGYTFQINKMLNDNLKIITSYQERYDISAYKLLPLNLQLFINYTNMFQFYEAEKLLDWFNNLDKKGEFQLWSMSNEERLFYARYLGSIGGYYKARFGNWHKVLDYSLRTREVLKKVSNYPVIKCNNLYNIASSYTSLGYVHEARETFDLIEKNNEFKDLGQITRIMKSKLYYYIGDEESALEEIDKEINGVSKSNNQINNILYLTDNYLLKAEILNSLNRYDEAYYLAEQLYQAHKGVTGANNRIFGRIYTQMARSKLGQGDIAIASDYINQAASILLMSEYKDSNEDDNYSEDPDLAAMYIGRGDVFFAMNNLSEAIDSYKKARIIYFYLFKDRSKNIPQISYLYTQGAKASCKRQNLDDYKYFAKDQVKDFGVSHPDTVVMFEYCRDYNMDLSAKS